MSLRRWFTCTGSRHTNEFSHESAASSSSTRSQSSTEPSSSTSSCPGTRPAKRACISDLGVDSPKQVRLASYPMSEFGKKKRSFRAEWYGRWDWLEYSATSDAAFCFPCRKFGDQNLEECQGMRLEPAFARNGYRDWKHATELHKGFPKHAASKEHLACYSTWKEKANRSALGQEISTLVSSATIERNRFYFSTLIDIAAFLAIHQLAFRGRSDAFASTEKEGNGLFMSFLFYTMEKDERLRKVVDTIPGNATYTSADMQNELIAAMSSVVTDKIREEIGESWYTIKADGTKDSTGTENISIVVRFFNQHTLKVMERLLVISSTDSGDAQSLTDVILAEISKAGLKSTKIFSQVYDGASVMAGKNGGVQRILQEREDREIPYIHCFNHQLHLVVVHAMSAERPVKDFLHVCGELYNFFRKPTVSLHYNGEKLKRLLEQRWTGHLATVTTILRSFEPITSLLQEICESRTRGADMRMEATGLLREVSEKSFLFIAQMLYKVSKKSSDYIGRVS